MAAPIRSEDSPQEKITKLLPADITAAFLSAKAGLIAGAGEAASTYIFWTFVSILILSPAYFWYVTRARNVLQVLFLMLSFVVFAVSIADVQFTNYLEIAFPQLRAERVIKVVAIVLPILWVFVISQIFVSALGDTIAEHAPAHQTAKAAEDAPVPQTEKSAEDAPAPQTEKSAEDAPAPRTAKWMSRLPRLRNR